MRNRKLGWTLSHQIACILFCAFALPSNSAFGNPIIWALDGVEFTTGTQATGFFEYDADTNSVTNIDIVTALATYTSIAPTFPAKPYEFIFIPSVPLSFGADIPALALFASPALTDAGGSVSLGGINGFSSEGAICDDACDTVNLGHQIDQGELTGVSVPEPVYAPVLSVASFFLILRKRSEWFGPNGEPSGRK
jgi:hypothetical protein